MNMNVCWLVFNYVSQQNLCVNRWLFTRNFVKIPLGKKTPPISSSSVSTRWEKHIGSFCLKIIISKKNSDDTTDRILRCCKTNNDFIRIRSLLCACFVEKMWRPCPTDGLTGFYGPPNLMHEVKTNAHAVEQTLKYNGEWMPNRITLCCVFSLAWEIVSHCGLRQRT